MATDQFGITQLYSTATGGREWFNTWGNGVPRRFRHTSSYDIPVNQAGQGINQDPQDNEFISLGAGPATWSMDGSGIAVWRQYAEPVGDIRAYMGIDYPAGGTFPPYEFATQGRQTWQNCEMTGYVRLWKVAEGGTATVCRIVIRSDHFNIQNCNCDAKGYDYQFAISGTEATQEYAMRISKEIIHDVYTSPSDLTNVSQSHFPDADISSFSEFASVKRVPLLRWVGMKYVVRNITSNGQIRLEAYRDMTNGTNGGDWVLMATLDDDGVDGHWGARSTTKRDQLDVFWASTGGCGNTTTNCNEDPNPYVGNYNPIISRPGYGCYYRTDGCARVDLKWFSIREIDPIATP